MNKLAAIVATGLALATQGGAAPAILWTRPLVETDRYIGSSGGPAKLFGTKWREK